jgi:transposase
MKPYSMDLRQRVLTDCDAGLTTAQVAAKYTVSPAWVRRLKQRRRQTGEVAPRAARPGPPPSWGAYAGRLRDAVRRQPDATLAELRDRLGLAVALSTLWRAVAALRLTVKKKSSGRPSRTAPT